MAMAVEDVMLANLEKEITGTTAVRPVDEKARPLGALAVEAVLAETQQAITALHQSSTALTASIARVLEQSDREMAQLRVRLSELQELMNMAATGLDQTSAMLNDYTKKLSGQIALGTEHARRVVSSSEALQRELRGDAP